MFKIFPYVFYMLDFKISAPFHNTYVFNIRNYLIDLFVACAVNNAWKLPGSFQAHVSVLETERCLLKVMKMLHSGIVWKDLLIKKGKTRKSNDLSIQCFNITYYI